jgi:hypothetical protein
MSLNTSKKIQKSPGSLEDCVTKQFSNLILLDEQEITFIVFDPQTFLGLFFKGVNLL